jgi:hypothetical protein
MPSRLNEGGIRMSVTSTWGSARKTPIVPAS